MFRQNTGPVKWRMKFRATSLPLGRGIFQVYNIALTQNVQGLGSDPQHLETKANQTTIKKSNT